MILTVTPNPAVDVTYVVDRLTPGDVHRVERVLSRPGGKGVNVARVLHQLDEDVEAVGLGDASFGAGVEESGIRATFVDVLTTVRRTVVVSAGGETTSLWEPGSPAPEHARRALLDLVGSRLDAADIVVVSGSLPPGLDAGVPVAIADLAREAGVPAVLDLDGDALARAAEAGGAVLAPNRVEAMRVLGPLVLDDPAAAARQLSGRTRAPVVITLGEDGIVAADGAETWRTPAPELVTGNPTGAGDAVTAAVARGLVRGTAWPEILHDATALGAAAVRSPVAGEVDLPTYEALRTGARA